MTSFVALAGAEQAEAQDHRGRRHAEPRLDEVRVDERQIRDAVGDHVEGAGVDAVDASEQLRGGPRHDDSGRAGRR